MSALGAAGLVIVAGGLGLGVVMAAGAAVTTQRLSAGADAAALAAADAVAGFATGGACDRALEVAIVHGVSLGECEVDGLTVTVSVSTSYAGFPASVTARAGSTSLAGSSGTATGWARPSDGVVTSGFGPREAQCDGSSCASTFHEGIDFAAGCGTPIYAAQSGVVVLAGADGGFGNHVRIDHGAGLQTGYAHIQDSGILVTQGESVIAGQLIALEGDTGRSLGCHLHFEVLQNGTLVDPASYVAG